MSEISQGINSAVPKQEIAPPERSVHLTFLPGMLGSDKSMQPLSTALSERGFKTEMLTSSMPPSPENPDPHKIDRVSKALAERLKTSDELNVLIGHSGGAGELPQIMDALNKIDPNLLKDYAHKLDVLFIAPAGLNGLTKTLHRFMSIVPPLASRFVSKRTGLETMRLFPKAELDNRTVLDKLAKLAHIPSNVSLEDLPPESPGELTQEHWRHVNEQKKEKVAKIDIKIQDILSQVDNPKQNKLAKRLTEFRAKRLLSRRGGLLMQEAGKVFSNAESDLKLENIAKGFGPYIQALRGIALPSFAHALSGQLPKVMDNLSELGVNYRFIVPQYDTFVTKQDLDEKDIPEEKRIGLPGTHADWVAQSKVFTDTLANMYLQPTK